MADSKTIDDGGQAFPHLRNKSEFGSQVKVVDGMTIRDYFAAKAMQSMITRGEDDGVYASECAYRYADAMLRARKGASK